MKKFLIAYYGDSPVCVEGFPKDCQRSRKGSVHIHPKKPTTVTGDELEVIKKQYKVKVVAEYAEEKVKAEGSTSEPSPPSKEGKSSAKGGKKKVKKKAKKKAKKKKTR